MRVRGKAQLPIKVDDLGLTSKVLKFVTIYAETGDEVDAIVKAGLLSESASPSQKRLKALTLVNDPNVKIAVERYLSNAIEPYKQRTIFTIMRQLQVRASWTPDIFYHPDGTAKSLDDIPKEWQLAIDGVTESFFGKNADVRVVQYKLSDRAQSHKQLVDLLKLSKAESGEEETGGNSDEGRAKLKQLLAKSAGKEVGARIANELLKHDEAKEQTTST